MGNDILDCVFVRYVEIFHDSPLKSVIWVTTYNYHCFSLFSIVALQSSPADRNEVQENCRTKFREGLHLQEGEFLLQVNSGK